ncbi:MAG: M42 family metallopeptidase [Anaerolineae bacterium]|nr:M42 family metallopeptidase [Anaerolineae bacterium]
MKDTLCKLSQAYGPSGNEGQIRDLIRSEVEGLADVVTVDALGNLVAVKGSGGRRVMLAAHMDEIGIIVSHIDEKGFLRFGTIGGVRALGLVGSRVRFADGSTGVIGVEKLEDGDKIPALSKLFIDVGARSRDDVRVKVGDIASMDRPFGQCGSRFIGKAMDDRAGCAVLIETLRRLDRPRNEVHFAFTTQEEVGLRGATTCAYCVDPQVALAVDVTGTGDTPKCPVMAVSLGEGAAIKVRDGGMLAHPAVKDLLVARAEEKGIPYQLEVLEGGTTDARVMQTTRAGVPTGAVSVPCRYIHTPSEMIDERDAEAAVNLLLAFVENDISL